MDDKRLSRDEVLALLKADEAAKFKVQPKVNPAFTREQYFAIADAYQAGNDSVNLNGRVFNIIRTNTNGKDWVVVMPVVGFCPAGCYEPWRFADLTDAA